MREEVPWRTVEQALFEIESVMPDAEPDEMDFLVAHNEYLLQCQAQASSSLKRS